MTREEAIKRIRAGLKKRSGKVWRVRGDSGTAWGWIHISAPQKRLTESGEMTVEDVEELAKLLDVPPVVGTEVLVASGDDYYQEYVDRAEGRVPSVIGKPYWD